MRGKWLSGLKRRRRWMDEIRQCVFFFHINLKICDYLDDWCYVASFLCPLAISTIYLSLVFY